MVLKPKPPQNFANSSGLKPLNSKHWSADLVTGEDEVLIVAVHGLNGDLMKTWTHEGSGKVWPQARIYTYGYDSQIPSLTTATIHDYGEMLLNAIHSIRTSDNEVRTIWHLINWTPI